MTSSTGGIGPDANYSGRVIRGQVAGVTRTAAVGLCTVATTGSVPVDVWSGASVYPFMTAATSLEVVSSSASDTAAGIGMQSVTITGLDASYNAITSTVSMNGITAVAIPTQFFRINNVRGNLITPITGNQTNVGTITVRDAGAGTTRGIIPIGIGSAQQAVYTTPAGFTLMIHSLEVQIASSAGGTARGADVYLVFRQNNGFVITPRLISTTDVQPYALDTQTGIAVTEKTDFLVRVVYTSNNVMKVGASWEAHLYKNT